MVERIATDVLVVGGGGAGLTASMLLSTMGIDHHLVSSLPTTSVLPKAHVLGQRAMEVLEDCGAANAIYAVGTPPEQFARTAFYAGVAGHELAGSKLFIQESWGGGGADPDWVAASPKLTTNLPQIRLEPIMKARAEELAPGRINFHHEVVSVTQDDRGVLAFVRDHDRGVDYEVAALYLMACDGGRSVGRMVGIELEGLAELGRTATFHLRADFSGLMGDPDVLLRWVFCPSNAKMVVLAPMGPTRWGADSEEWVAHINYDLNDERAHDDEAVMADLREALGIPDHPLEVLMLTRWVVGGVLADRFREGRVFVLGDAAHRHPPTGGLGLVSAIHDAQNLCWKLALVLRGQAGDELLDTYEAERRVVDARNLQRSLENAMGYGIMAAALDFFPDRSVEDRWASLARCLGDAPEDAAFRREIRNLMAAQSQEFREHDVEYNYSHRSSAVVEDGTTAPELQNLRSYVPSTRPGSPLPHAWLEDDRFERCSTLDLVAVDRFTLIAGEDGEAWKDAAREVGAALGLTIDAYTVGHSDGDLRDPRLRFEQVRGFGRGGAVLVRPDRCVAFRAMDAADDPVGVLRSALQQILSRSA